MRGCVRLDRELNGSASLECMEPNLRVELKMERNGSIEIRIEITPDQMTEHHSFNDTVDQSHLPAIIRQCQSVLELYPIREPESLPSDA
jgi:hypothetical protein